MEYSQLGNNRIENNGIARNVTPEWKVITNDLGYPRPQNRSMFNDLSEKKKESLNRAYENILKN